MSLARNCDVVDCKRQGKPYCVEYLFIEILPTGNPWDYSATEEKEVRNAEFDLCEKHAKEYDKRIASVIVKDSEGLRFP